MPRRLDGERRNSLPTHLSESESERAVGMWMERGREEGHVQRAWKERESECPSKGKKGKHNKLKGTSFITISFFILHVFWVF